MRLSTFIGLLPIIMLASFIAYSVHYTRTCERELVTDIVINGTTGKAELGQVSVCK